LFTINSYELLNLLSIRNQFIHASQERNIEVFLHLRFLHHSRRLLSARKDKKNLTGATTSPQEIKLEEFLWSGNVGKDNQQQFHTASNLEDV